MRPLRDRLADVLRTARLDGAGGAYLDQPDDVREDWRRTADRVLASALNKGIAITDTERRE